MALACFINTETEYPLVLDDNHSTRIGTFRSLFSLQRLSRHRWLRAIRDSLVLLLPVTFVGALALLAASFPLWIHDASSPWSDAALLVWRASNGILSLCLVVLIAQHLAADLRENYLVDVSPPLVATLALVDFFLVVSFAPTPEGQWMLGPRSVLVAILVAIVSTELFFCCQRLRFLHLFRHSFDLDPTLHLAVRAIVPTITVVGLFCLANRLLLLIPFDGVHAIKTLLFALQDDTGSQLPGLILVGLLGQFLWFFGIHGPNVLESVYPYLFNGAAQSGQVFDISKSFYDLYVHLGGSGATLGILLAILIHARRSEAARIAKYAWLPAVFNINEILIYGLPIVFNPVYLIPFILAPLAEIVLTFEACRSGFLVLDVAAAPWTTPPLISGFLNSGDWRGSFIQCCNIVLSTLIYLPFVRMAAEQRRRESIDTMHRVISSIENLHFQHRVILDRRDDIGHVARKLLQEFMLDLRSGVRVALAYQPQHDAQGRIVGIEALLRWRHRDYGPIPAAVVCALAEESSQIVTLGRWTIETACRQLAEWRQAGIDAVRVSVNLSPVQLRDDTLLDFIKKTLAQYQLQAIDLGFELTESQHVPDTPGVTKTLADLHRAGHYLAMDDFGMGYSSMVYIRRFHFDAIKLDGSLTRDVMTENNCRDIISSIVQLGNSLGLMVIAEYVESMEQREVLLQLGCDAFQGHLFTAALQADECFGYLLEAAKNHGGTFNR